MTNNNANSTQFQKSKLVVDAIDIRDKKFRPRLTLLKQEIEYPKDLQILNQTSDACTGYALAAVINLLNQKRKRNVKVSPTMLHELAKKYDHFIDDGGQKSTLRGAIKGWFNMGVCEQSNWEKDGLLNKILTVERAKNARNNTIGTYYRIRKNIVDFHAALNEAGVIYAGAKIHVGWLKDEIKDGVIPKPRFELPQINGEYLHAFAIIGYNDKGFWVQNSEGEDWGERGVALWTYEDWQENHRDAWVLNLAVPTPQIWHTINVLDNSNAPTGSIMSRNIPRRNDIAGHFAHIDDGQFHLKGRYWSNLNDVKQTADHIQQSDYYEHLLIYVHGGLNSDKDSARRISAMKNVFMDNKIYPYHFMYDTGLMEEIKDSIFRKKSKSVDRFGSIPNVTDPIIEHIIRKPGRAIWREMKYGAKSPFYKKGAGAEIIQLLSHAASFGSKPLKIHLVGHSAGSILLAYLINYWSKNLKQIKIESCSLFAPACTIDLFNQTYLPNLGEFINKLNIYKLTDHLEKSDEVSIYKKSLLYLVSKAFEENRGEAILGMQKFESRIKSKNGLKIFHSQSDSKMTKSKTHGGFDNDVTTMNHILKTVLGTSPKVPFMDKNLTY